MKRLLPVILFALAAALLPATTARAQERQDSLSVSPAPRQSLQDSLITFARTFMGKPYKLGAEGPNFYDCSSFVRASFRGIGIELPRNTVRQILEGEGVLNPQELRRGDIVLFGKRQGVREVGHVGIVVDVDLEHCDFTFIHCGVNNGVEIQRYSNPYFLMRYLTGRRIFEEK